MEFELDKVEEYTTSQLQIFLDEIEEYWIKTNELYSMTDLLEINRELTLREFRDRWRKRARGLYNEIR
tara:strand:- start:1863 stop:2066 length:204 start_codon:yes stop_codon:yes gene_type:complete